MIEKIVDYGIGNGLNGFYLTGTTGEWWLLSLDERKLVMDAAVKASKGRCKLIAHVGANCTDDSVALAAPTASPSNRSPPRSTPRTRSASRSSASSSKTPR